MAYDYFESYKVKIKVTMSTNFVGSEYSEEIEVQINDGDSREQNCDDAAREWLFEQIEFSWKEVKYNQ